MNLPSNLKAYHPATTGSDKPLAAIVICPGGGYGHLAAHEGGPVAEWLCSLGIAGYVLTYRHTAANPHPAPLEDVLGAIRYLKSHAVALGLDANRVGVLGFSAGGHLAASAAVHGGQSGNAMDRPDLAVLVYPVISMQAEITHAGSRENLLGKTPAPELVARMSCELQVTAATPPCFLFHTADDQPVPVENTLRMAAALAANKVPFEVLILEHGSHGVGLASGDRVLSQWTSVCGTWLARHGFGT
jgi:acetyl esterase/lipase